MTSPNITMVLIDPGAVGLPVNNAQIPIYVGVAASGDIGVVREFARRSQVVETYGHGHLVDVLTEALAAGATSVKACRVTASDATTPAEDSDNTLVVTSITGEALNFLAVRIEVVSPSAGAISAGAVYARYTLDNWDIPNVEPTYSDVFKVPVNGVIVLPNVGLTVTLDPAQIPDIGDAAEFSTVPGHYGATDIAALSEPLRSPLAGEYTYLVFTGDAETAAAANTCALSVISLLSGLFSKAYFVGALAGAGLEPDTSVITATVSSVADPPFLSMGYGASYTTNAAAEIARGRTALREHEAAAIRIAGSLISTDPGRVASGALKHVVGTDYDSALKGDALHDARISVLRTWEPATKGLYVKRQRLLSQSGSNFRSWQHAAVMITALRAAHRINVQLMLDNMRANADGTIDGRDAADVKASTEKELKRVLADEQNARGTRGHVSAYSATVDRVLQLPALRIDIRIRPLYAVEDLTVALQYASEV